MAILFSVQVGIRYELCGPSTNVHVFVAHDENKLGRSIDDGDDDSRVSQDIETALISAIHSPRLVFLTVMRCSCSNLIPGDDDPANEEIA